FQAEDGIRDFHVTGVQTCALPIYRLFDLDLGPAAMAFAGASTPQDQRDMDRVLLDAGVPGFAGAWLRHRGLDWAAELLPSFPGRSEERRVGKEWRSRWAPGRETRR